MKRDIIHKCKRKRYRNRETDKEIQYKEQRRGIEYG